MGFDLWVAPLILLPGIGLLIMSTSIRFGQLQGHMMKVLSDQSPTSMTLVRSLHLRGHLFRAALLSFYTSAGMFTLASTLNGINGLLAVQLPIVMVVFTTVIGFIALLLGGLALFIESISSADIMEEYYQRLLQHKEI